MGLFDPCESPPIPHPKPFWMGFLSRGRVKNSCKDEQPCTARPFHPLVALVHGAPSSTDWTSTDHAMWRSSPSLLWIEAYSGPQDGTEARGLRLGRACAWPLRRRRRRRRRCRRRGAAWPAAWAAVTPAAALFFACLSRAQRTESQHDSGSGSGSGARGERKDWCSGIPPSTPCTTPAAPCWPWRASVFPVWGGARMRRRRLAYWPLRPTDPTPTRWSPQAVSAVTPTLQRG